MPIGKQEIEEALAELPKLFAAIRAVPALYVQCQDFRNQDFQTEADALIHVFCRHSLRTVHYARNFLRTLLDLRTVQVDGLELGKSVGVPIEDDIFFDFDAFVFSAKSIFDESIVNKARALHKDALQVFIKFAEQAKHDFVDRLLNTVRNEVVHLNAYGSGAGSFARLTNRGHYWEIRILTNFYTEGGEEIELVSLFFEMFTHTKELIMKILGVFVLHLFRTFGKPERNIGYSSGGVEIRLSDYPIPESPTEAWTICLDNLTSR